MKNAFLFIFLLFLLPIPGSATFFYKDQMVDILGFGSHVVFVTTTELCSTRSVIDNASGHDRFPIKLY